MSSCLHDFGQVINTRKRGDYVYRRRKCYMCRNYFTTIEMARAGFAASDLADKIKSLRPDDRDLLTQLADRLGGTKAGERR